MCTFRFWTPRSSFYQLAKRRSPAAADDEATMRHATDEVSDYRLNVLGMGSCFRPCCHRAKGSLFFSLVVLSILWSKRTLFFVTIPLGGQEDSQQRYQGTTPMLAQEIRACGEVYTCRRQMESGFACTIEPDSNKCFCGRSMLRMKHFKNILNTCQIYIQVQI